MTVRLAPSLLAADLTRLGAEVKAMEEAGADLIHIDVMDGHFVPNISFGPAFVKAFRSCTDLPLDVHLMLSPVDNFIPAFAEAGADIITIHPEAGPHLHRSLQLIRQLGKRAGVALSPATPTEAIRHVLTEVDLILIMSVNPGFGGQKFIPEVLPKVRELREYIDETGLDVALEIDGGITSATAPSALLAGIDILVAGTAAFAGGPSQYADNLKSLRIEP